MYIKLKQYLPLSIASKIVGFILFSMSIFLFKPEIYISILILLILTLWYFYFPTMISVEDEGILLGFLFGNIKRYTWDEIVEIKLSNYYTHKRMLVKVKLWTYAFESYEISNFKQFYEKLFTFKES